MSGLGRLVRVPRIEEVWPSEPRAFTPWLAEEAHLDLLSQALGFGPEGLELIRTETAVGGFRGDILCRQTGPEGLTVLIENQFGATDHDHLGKLLTYAAGTGARVLVWIAEHIREEHEAAIDLLNGATDDSFQAFGVEIELWRIDDSPPAPKFNIVAKPNSWVRRGKAGQTGPRPARTLSATEQARLSYWTDMRAVLEAAHPPFNPVSPQPFSWISHGVGKAGVGLNLCTSIPRSEIRVEIYLSGPTAKGYFALLEKQRDAVEAALGYALDWQALDGGNDARICIADAPRDPLDCSDWAAQHAWLAERAIAFHHVFHPLVRGLDREAGLMLS